MKLHRSVWYLAQLCTLSAFFVQAIFDGVMGLQCFFHYILYRDFILSAQVLQYRWREFNETSQKCLVLCLVVHTVGVFCSTNFFTQLWDLVFSYRDLILSAQVSVLIKFETLPSYCSRTSVSSIITVSSMMVGVLITFSDCSSFDS